MRGTMRATSIPVIDRSAAHFTVVSDKISPDEICKRLGIKCDSSIWKGTPNPSGKPKTHPLNIAIFRSRISDSLPLEEHAQDILSRIAPVRSNLKRLPGNCIQAIHFNYRVMQDGGWTFDPGILATLAALAVPCVFSLEAGTTESAGGSKRKK
jgi:hypothetical protein